ncbi:hypothetical protein V8E54_001090 [Elaphomyces granulatus]
MMDCTRPVRNLSTEGLEVLGSSNPYASYPHWRPSHHSSRSRFPGSQFPHDQGPLHSHSQQVCGLRPTAFWLLGIIAVVIIGGAVGAGVGAVLANNTTSSTTGSPNLATTNTSTSPSVSSSTIVSTQTGSTMLTSITVDSSSTSFALPPTTLSAPVTSGSTGMAQSPCPGANQTTYSSSGPLFTLFCAVDWPRGDDFPDGTGTVVDLESSMQYTLNSCIESCVSYNKDFRSNAIVCQGITYQPNLTANFLLGAREGNCFLKNHIGRYFPTNNGGVSAGIEVYRWCSISLDFMYFNCLNWSFYVITCGTSM